MRVKSLILGAVILLSVSSNFASADELAKTNMAVIDIPRVLQASPEVKALKLEQEKNIQSLMETIEKAKKEIATATDKKKADSLNEKYVKELAQKKAAMEKAYEQKLISIEDSIQKTIDEQGKAEGYDIIFSKNSVLYGGTDITDGIIKKLNNTATANKK